MAIGGQKARCARVLFLKQNCKSKQKQLERLDCFLFDTKQCIGSLMPIYATKEVDILMNSFRESI